MAIKAVLFDLDDTLFDYESCNQEATKEIFKEIFAQAGFNGKQINKMLSLF